MRATELCPPPHLEAADFEGDTVVTIKRVDFAEVGDEKVTKGVVYFDEHKRGLVLNRTNLKRIVGLHGSETDDWVGKKITLYPSETDFGGKTVDCIRVREKK
jgi:hypothetical protein